MWSFTSLRYINQLCPFSKTANFQTEQINSSCTVYKNKANFQQIKLEKENIIVNLGVQQHHLHSFE